MRVPLLDATPTRVIPCSGATVGVKVVSRRTVPAVVATRSTRIDVPRT